MDMSKTKVGNKVKATHTVLPFYIEGTIYTITAIHLKTLIGNTTDYVFKLKESNFPDAWLGITNYFEPYEETISLERAKEVVAYQNQLLDKATETLNKATAANVEKNTIITKLHRQLEAKMQKLSYTDEALTAEVRFSNDLCIKLQAAKTEASVWRDKYYNTLGEAYMDANEYGQTIGLLMQVINELKRYIPVTVLETLRKFGL